MQQLTTSGMRLNSSVVCSSTDDRPVTETLSKVPCEAMHAVWVPHTVPLYSCSAADLVSTLCMHSHHT